MTPANTLHNQTPPRGARLTRREREILTFVAQGLKATEVAEILFVSKRTIDYHLASAYAKLGAKNRIQAIVAASRLGLVVYEPDRPFIDSHVLSGAIQERFEGTSVPMLRQANGSQAQGGQDLAVADRGLE